MASDPVNVESLIERTVNVDSLIERTVNTESLIERTVNVESIIQGRDSSVPAIITFSQDTTYNNGDGLLEDSDWKIRIEGGGTAIQSGGKSIRFSFDGIFNFLSSPLTGNENIIYCPA